MSFSAKTRQEENAQIFTFAERTVPRYTHKQAFEQAAMVYRTLRDLPANQQLFPGGSYDTFDKDVVYTAEKFSDRVDDIVYFLINQES